MISTKHADSEGYARELDERVVELQSLFEMSQLLNSSLNLQNILNNLLLTPMGRMMINRGLVMITDENGNFSVHSVKGLSKQLLGLKFAAPFELSRSLLFSEVSTVDAAVTSFFQEHNIDLLIPISSTTRIVGLLCLGKKIGQVPFVSSEIEFLSSLANIAASSIENALMYLKLEKVNKQLDKKIQELNTLFEIGKELNSTLEKERIVNLMIFAIMGELLVNRCVVLTRNDRTTQFDIHKSATLQENDLESLQGKGLQKSLARLTDPLFIGDENLLRNLWILQRLNYRAIIPMRIQDKTKGIVLLGEKINKQPYRTDELDFLTTLSNLAMTAIENARLFEQALEKERLEEELNIAREIQQRLLPSSYPKLNGIEIGGLNIPSRQVGGDYFDCIQLNDQHIALVIADVSGKGVPASLIMSNLQAGLHALVTSHMDITAMVARLNNLIYAHTSYDRFITFFFAQIDLEDFTLTYVNAGHNNPYLIHCDGTFQMLATGGLLLGMMPNMSYQQQVVPMQKGDTLYMYTDGVTEAKDVRGREFEEWRLEKILVSATKKQISIPQLLEEVNRGLKSFVKNAPQADDITMLALKVSEIKMAGSR